jgi:hypothetical protein
MDQRIEIKCTRAVLNAISRIPAGETRPWKDLENKYNWYMRLGIVPIIEVRDCLVEDGAICYEKTTGQVWSQRTHRAADAAAGQRSCKVFIVGSESCRNEQSAFGTGRDRCN